jgi:glycosyltransferase involved in cell wall biosynthesis
MNLLFSGHDFKFLAPFIDHCRLSNLYDIRMDKHKGHEIDSEDDARAHLDWADIIFCEWAMGNAVWYSRHKREGQLLVVRLHLQEVQSRDRISFIYDTDWSRVDRLVTITHHIYDWMRGEFAVLRDRTCMIYNPIDAIGKLNQPKTPESEYRLGLVGVVPQRKRIDLAVQILETLLREDPRYSLHIKGHSHEEYSWMLARKDEMDWYEQVHERIRNLPNPNAVVFEPHGDDMVQFYANMGFILSTSDFEGSHQAVAEGMAAGCIPIIRNWEGACRIYPPKYVVETVEDAARAVAQWNRPGCLADEQDYCRRYSQERFDLKAICNKLESNLIRHVSRFIPKATGLDQARLRPSHATLPPVLIVGYIPAGYRGGYRIRIEQEIRSLVRLGCPVYIACLHPQTDAEALRVHAEELAQLGCQVHLVSSPSFFDIQVSSDTFRGEIESLSKTIDRYDLEIVHAEALYTARLVMLLKEQMPGIKFVFDVHGNTPEEERMGGAHPNRISAMVEWENRVFASTDLNVFVSEAMCVYYRGKYDINSLCEIIPCCVSDESFHRDEISIPLDISPQRTVLTYLGTMAPWQGGEEMIRLFADLQRRSPDLFYLLLVPEGDHEKFRTTMARHGLAEEAVRLVESPFDQVNQYLSQTNVGFMLRRDDPVNKVSSPTKFGEYLAAGCPVVMTDGIGDYSHLSLEHDVGLVLNSELMDRPVWPDHELDQILAFVDRSCVEREAISRRCRDVAWENLHWEPASERLASTYSRLIMAL